MPNDPIPQPLPQRTADFIEECREMGVDPVPLLCRRLEGSSVRLGTEAAIALGELGDPRAIEPLMAALRKSARGVTPRRHLFWTASVAVISVAMMIVAPLLAMKVLGNDVGYTIFGGLAVLLYATHRFEKLAASSRVIGTALKKLSETCPAPALREALPALESIAANGMAYRREVRDEARATAAAIAAATAEAEALPIPSADVGTSSEALPLPAVGQQAVSDEALLPRIRL